jgi:hypothetical protein
MRDGGCPRFVRLGSGDSVEMGGHGGAHLGECLQGDGAFEFGKAW